jgi:hypothetical protein
VVCLENNSAGALLPDRCGDDENLMAPLGYNGVSKHGLKISRTDAHTHDINHDAMMMHGDSHIERALLNNHHGVRFDTKIHLQGT